MTSLVLQLVVPGAAAIWLGFRRCTSRGAWCVRASLALGSVAVASLAVPWLVVPSPVRYVLLAAWAAAAIAGWRRVEVAGRRQARGSWRVVTLAIELVAAAAVWSVAAMAVDGRRPPSGPVIDLTCPLGSGSYLIASGGSGRFVNAHFVAVEADSRAAALQGLRNGIDVVQVDALGRRARRLVPHNLVDYFIYGQLVVAPCSGTVVAAVDDRPDMAPGVRDAEGTHPAGNHVIVRCGDYEVALAHLQPGSVRVGDGETVATGDLLGFVGNSGHTDEPHLHVSAQRSAMDGAPFGGAPVWLTIGGTFVVRNDSLVCR